MNEARQLNHSYVGTEHLLLGLLRSGDAIVTAVLEQELQVTLDRARAETLRLLGADVSQGERLPGSALEFDIRVTYPDGRLVEHRCRGKREALRLIDSL